MGLPLYIPWFKLEAWDVPTLYAIIAVVIGAGVAALNPKWREQAISTGGFLLVAGILASFKWDEIPIQPFGVLVATGVLLGTRLGEWRAKETGIAPWLLADFATHVVVIGFISCYILNGIFYETDKLLEILEDPSKIFELWLGLSSFGGFFGAIFGIWVWKIRKERGGKDKLPVLRVADAAAFGLPLGWFFGRMGCFTVHDHPGKTTEFFLAVNDYCLNWADGVCRSPGPRPPRHDLGFYEVLWSAAVVILFIAIRKVKKPVGFYLLALPLLYAPVRFFLDYLRIEGVENADVRWAGLTPGQYSSIIMFFIPLVVFFYIRKREPLPVPDKWAWPPKAEAEKDDEPEDEPESKSTKRRKLKKK